MGADGLAGFAFGGFLFGGGVIGACAAVGFGEGIAEFDEPGIRVAEALVVELGVHDARCDECVHPCQMGADASHAQSQRGDG